MLPIRIIKPIPDKPPAIPPIIARVGLGGTTKVKEIIKENIIYGKRCLPVVVEYMGLGVNESVVVVITF